MFADDSNKTPAIIPAVPNPICQLNNSPKNQIPRMAANTGVVELMVEDSVGPKNLIPATERLADREGRNMPTKIKMKTAEFKK